MPLSLASETPSALLDWNNNYGGDPDKAVCFHCSNLPKHFFREGVKMDFQQIIAGTVGKENTFGTLDGRVKAGPMTFARFSTDEFSGTITRLRRAGELYRRSVDDLRRSGRGGDPKHAALLRYICENGFEHHVAANFSHVGEAVKEAGRSILVADALHSLSSDLRATEASGIHSPVALIEFRRSDERVIGTGRVPLIQSLRCCFS